MHEQTNPLHDINWGALDYSSRAPQLMSCNYYTIILHMQRVCIIKVIVTITRTDHLSLNDLMLKTSIRLDILMDSCR